MALGKRCGRRHEYQAAQDYTADERAAGRHPMGAGKSKHDKTSSMRCRGMPDHAVIRMPAWSCCRREHVPVGYRVARRLWLTPDAPYRDAALRLRHQ